MGRRHVPADDPHLAVNAVVPQVTTPSQVNEGQSFTLNLSAPTNVDSWFINWGDGTTSDIWSGSPAEHTYEDDGLTSNPSDVYTISVIARRNSFDSAPVTKSITVNNVAPTLSTPLLTPGSIYPGDSVSITSVISDPGMMDSQNVVVNWGDGSPEETLWLTGAGGYWTFGSGSPVTHMYQSVGNYSVKVFAWDDDMTRPQTATWTGNVTVNPIVPTLVAPPSVKEGESFSLNLSAPANVDWWFISWGDGTTSEVWGYSSNSTATHSYQDDGPTTAPTDTYTIQVTAHRTGYSSEPATRAIEVKNVAPSINSLNVTADPSNPFKFDLDANWSDPGISDSVDYEIIWNDGEQGTRVTSSGTASSALIEADHTYTDIGIYKIRLILTDKDGGTTEETFEIEIAEQELFLDVFIADGDSGSIASHAAGLLDDVGTGAIAQTIAFTVQVHRENINYPIDDLQLVVEVVDDGWMLAPSPPGGPAGGWVKSFAVTLDGSSPFLDDDGDGTVTAPIFHLSPLFQNAVDKFFTEQTGSNPLQFSLTQRVRFRIERVETGHRIKDITEIFQFEQPSVTLQSLIHNAVQQTVTTTVTQFVHEEIGNRLRLQVEDLFQQGLATNPNFAVLYGMERARTRLLDAITAAEQTLADSLLDAIEGVQGRIMGLVPKDGRVSALLNALNNPSAVAADLLAEVVPGGSPLQPMISLNFLTPDVVNDFMAGNFTGIQNRLSANPMYFVRALGMRLEVTLANGQPPVYLDFYMEEPNFAESLRRQTFTLNATASGDITVGGVPISSGLLFGVEYNHTTGGVLQMGTAFGPRPPIMIRRPRR